jgi:hypothetical protein
VKIEYLLGMGPLGKKFCLILDIDKVLSADEILAVTESTGREIALEEPIAGTPLAKQRQARMGR